MAVEASATPAHWTRSYPPLALLAVAVLIAAFVLPSSLNLPQSNPSTVLEYAPVPPSDDDPSSDDGNLSSLGLGSSSTLGIGGRPPPPPPNVRNLRNLTARPTSKRCVGKPARQIEDPMAPPCVPFFEGDNFGSTYLGVTSEEIIVLLLLDYGCPNNECARQPATYYDLDEPPKPPCPKTFPAGNPNSATCDYVWVRISRAFNRYFNDRFQQYGRRVHYIAYFTGASSDNARRQDAVDNWQAYKPFAVIDYGTYYGHNTAYDDAIAARGTMVFSSRGAQPASFYRRYAPNSWGFWPDVEHWAPEYITYLCSKVKGFPVKHSGNPNGVGPMNGQPRKYGLWYTTDRGEPGLRLFVEKVKAGMTACGMQWATESTFQNSGFIISSEPPADAAAAVAQFQANGVTTVLYLGGSEGKFSQAAAEAKYYPEIVVAGDLENDSNWSGRLQNQETWQNAWGTHLQLRLDRPEDAPGWQAMREANPQANPEDSRFANEMYRDHFMLFSAIQVAGPDLTPESVDKGFHAIPIKERSESPYTAACYFDPADYTCNKDATEFWWDPSGVSPDGGLAGCIRLVRGGVRYQPGEWVHADEAFGSRERDPCSAWESRYQLRIG